ncbi:hypothetical protein N307_02963, partial [Dryobates pubescens]
ILEVNCNDTLITLFPLLYIMRDQEAHEGSNKVPVVLRAANIEEKHTDLTLKV